MNENIKITREQVVFLTVVSVMGNIVYIHTWIDDYVNRAAWVSAMLAVLFIIPFAIWILYLSKLFPSSTVFDILESTFGKFLCIIFSTIFIILNIGIAATHLNMYTELIKVFSLQFTPHWVIVLFLMIMTVLLVNSGITVFGRLVEILTVIGALNFFLGFIVAFPVYIRTEFIFPVFDIPLHSFLIGTLFLFAAASESLLSLFIIVRHIPDAHRHYSWVAAGTILSSATLSYGIFIIIAIMSPELAKQIAFGGVNAARVITLGGFLQGLELFILGSYQFIAVGKISLCTYCTSMAAKKITGGRGSLLYIIAIAGIIMMLALWIRSYNKAYYIAVFLASYVIFPFSILVLLLCTISFKLKSKKERSASK